MGAGDVAISVGCDDALDGIHCVGEITPVRSVDDEDGEGIGWGVVSFDFNVRIEKWATYCFLE